MKFTNRHIINTINKEIAEFFNEHFDSAFIRKHKPTNVGRIALERQAR